MSAGEWAVILALFAAQLVLFAVVIWEAGQGA